MTTHVRYVLPVGGVLALALLALPGSAAAAGIDVGVRGGLYDPSEVAQEDQYPFAGIELVGNVNPHFDVGLNAEHIFDDLATHNKFNVDFNLVFPTSSALALWVGAGPALTYYEPDGPAGAETDLAANILFGVGLRGYTAMPYFQVKALLADETEMFFGGGVRF